MLEFRSMTLRIRQIAISALAASFSLAAFAVGAGEIQGVSLSSGATGTRAEIKLAGSGGYKTISLTAPHRLVVDFPDSKAVQGMKLPAATGMVTSVRTGQPQPGVFRVVFDLSDRVVAFKPQMQKSGSVSTLVIEWPGESGNAETAPKRNVAAAPVPQARPVVDPQAEAARATAALAASVQQAAAQPRPEPAPTVAGSKPMPVSVPPPTAVTVVNAQKPLSNAPVATTSSGVSAATILNGGRYVTSSSAIPVTAPPAAATTAVSTGNAQTPSSNGSAVTTASGVSAAAILNGRSHVTSSSVVSPSTVSPSAVTATETPNNAADTVRPVMPSDASRIKMRAGMRTLVVAIDPGHGGQDPGAIGPSGKREKDVTLAVARELARQVNATPGLKAFLTRESDVFIPLPMRAKKARAAGADIFISIHADAAENRSASGSSVYVLSTKGASSQRARWLADKENAADLVGGVRLQQTENTLANVLIDLAQSGHMKASEDAAGHVLGGLKRIGNNHKPELERANFAVLRTSDMPAMLVETAFISNPNEERRLTDPAYQRKLAGAVLEGVHTFFTRQPPPGTLYAARAQAEATSATGNVAGGSP